MKRKTLQRSAAADEEARAKPLLSGSGCSARSSRAETENRGAAAKGQAAREAAIEAAENAGVEPPDLSHCG